MNNAQKIIFKANMAVKPKLILLAMEAQFGKKLSGFMSEHTLRTILGKLYLGQDSYGVRELKKLEEKKYILKQQFINRETHRKTNYYTINLEEIESFPPPL